MVLLSGGASVLWGGAVGLLGWGTSVILGGSGVGLGCLNLTSLVGVISSSESSSRVNMNGESGSISGRESLISLNTWRMFAKILFNSAPLRSLLYSPLDNPWPDGGSSYPVVITPMGRMACKVSLISSGRFRKSGAK